MRSSETDQNQIENAKRHIDQINSRLKAAGIKASIRILKDSLYIRFTAPPKPGSNESKNRQYDYPVGAKLLSSQGRKKAESLAKEIGDYLPNTSNNLIEKSSEEILFNEVKKNITIREAKEIFREKYFVGKVVNPTTIQSFNNNCRRYLNRLSRFPEDQFLTPEVLIEIIEETEKTSQERDDICDVFQRLSDFCQLDYNLSLYKGKIRPGKERILPSDELIEETFNEISDPRWQWFYGLVATYGLRTHEPFFLNIDGYTQNGKFLEVTAGKTGPRQVFAYKPDWVEKFDLRNIKQPSFGEMKTFSHYGSKFNYHMRRCANLPFNLYDLRHAWAVRVMLRYSMKDTLAAKMMGHSTTVHTKTYLRWITQRDLIKAYLESIEDA
jgi:integrase